MNNAHINFKEYWDIISEVRHAVVHSSSRINKHKISKSQNHVKLFNRLFTYVSVDDETLQIELDYRKTKYLQKKISEFGFQIFKAISMTENVDWNIFLPANPDL